MITCGQAEISRCSSTVMYYVLARRAKCFRCVHIKSLSGCNYSERRFSSSGTSERCFSNWWSWGPVIGGGSATLRRPATQLQTTTPTTSWWASLSSLQPLELFYSRNSCILMTCFHFAPQNEPTFYTEDGTPFTAADPGEAWWSSATADTEKENANVQEHIYLFGARTKNVQNKDIFLNLFTLLVELPTFWCHRGFARLHPDSLLLLSSGPNVYSTCRVFEHLSLLFDRICWEIPRASGQTGLFRRCLWREWKRRVSAAVNLMATPNSLLITLKKKQNRKRCVKKTYDTYLCAFLAVVR